MVAALLAARAADGLDADVAVERTDARRLARDLGETEAARVEAEARHEAAARRLALAHRRLLESERRSAEAEASLVALSRESGEAEALRRDLAARVDEQAAEIARLTAALDAAGPGTSGAARATVERLDAAMDAVIAARDLLRAELQATSRRADALEAALAEAETREARLVADLEAAAAEGLARLEKMFESAEIALDRVLGAAKGAPGDEHTGQGGPLEPATAEALAVEDTRVAALLGDLERVSLMRLAADRVPFAMPVAGGRLTSSFGYRSDPFRKRRSMHSGIDIAAARGTPVNATAAGVVTFVGWQRGYGRVVEIRHAFGFETLYAHLDRTRVVLGQRVAKGERIGDMGSTGRSTGNHVHYEVRLDETAVNPLRFIEAARDVL
ncbi:MAG: peptidoglycan DD-metalloendopeptidase family protein [Paracoccaceae bacterium]